MRSPEHLPSQRRRRLLRAGGVLAAVGLAGCQVNFGTELSERTERTVDPEDAGAMTVGLRNGDVELSGEGTDVVSGTVVKRTRASREALGAVDVTATVEDGTLRIEADHSEVPPGASVSVDLELSVPASLPVVRAASENGDVTGRDLAGNGEYRTANGDVHAEGVEGYVTARSENGDVTVRVPGGLDGARTTNGDVDVDVPALRDDITCRTTNGDVTAAVAESVDAAVVLRTQNGDATVEGVDLGSPEASDARASGRLGEATHALDLRSVNGDVTLRSL
jgi:DUF4097 and DUF4098 domain-containing protein YvlB